MTYQRPQLAASVWDVVTVVDLDTKLATRTGVIGSTLGVPMQWLLRGLYIRCLRPHC